MWQTLAHAIQTRYARPGSAAQAGSGQPRLTCLVIGQKHSQSVGLRQSPQMLAQNAHEGVPLIHGALATQDGGHQSRGRVQDQQACAMLLALLRLSHSRQMASAAVAVEVQMHVHALCSGGHHGQSFAAMCWHADPA